MSTERDIFFNKVKKNYQAATKAEADKQEKLEAFREDTEKLINSIKASIDQTESNIKSELLDVTIIEDSNPILVGSLRLMNINKVLHIAPSSIGFINVTLTDPDNENPYGNDKTTLFSLGWMQPETRDCVWTITDSEGNTSGFNLGKFYELIDPFA